MTEREIILHVLKRAKQAGESLEMTARWISKAIEEYRRSQGEKQNMNHVLLQFFETSHLREDLRTTSEPFHVLAQLIVDTLPDNEQRTRALHKLLEAKDCAVRAALLRKELG